MTTPGEQSTSWPGPQRISHRPSRTYPDLSRSLEPQAGQRASEAPSAISISVPSQGNNIRRRPSLVERISSIANIGGVNSINSFSRSWKRAAGFYEVTSLQRYDLEQPEFSSPLDEDDDRTNFEDGLQPHTSLLRAALQREGYGASESPFEDDYEVSQSCISQPSEEVAARVRERRSSLLKDNTLRVQPQLESAFGGPYGAISDSLSSRASNAALQHAGRVFNEQQRATSSASDKERTPLLVKRVEPDDEVIARESVDGASGQSTLPQTIFNSVNVLIGVGLLSLPLAMRYSGWVIGLIFFLCSAITTSYTANLLAKCLDLDSTLITFADLAFISFGSKARIATSLLFTLELLAVCVALVILFADSLDALIPGWGITEFKIMCGIILIPLCFVPLRFLSFTSAIGILCCFGIVVAVFVDGILKPQAPGSLRDPETTYLFPKDWRTLPLAFGLLMAPWGGHSVFPNIYRDMRHPRKYTKAINTTYVFTYFLEVAMTIVGYLMFGEKVRDEITANILLNDDYPHWISIFITVAIAIIPITKVPLSSRPIISTIEIFCGLDPRAISSSSSLTGMSGFTRRILKVAIRVLMPVVLVAIAILVPSFDRVMTLLGSLACFTICIILPCSFHLKIFGKELKLRQRILDWTLIVVCTVLAVLGTVCSFLPKKLLGAER